MGLELAYETEKPQIEEGKPRYFFTSYNEITRKEIVKVIEYEYFQDMGTDKVFNLGFGDYDVGNKKIRDNVLTNNGDPRRVFNTVLNSIPTFFEENPNSRVFVSGSDSTDEFEDKCREQCVRTPSCKVDACKKRGQRIRTYCNYISKNFGELNKDYEFKGGLVNKVCNTTSLVNFVKGTVYDAVLVIKKN